MGSLESKVANALDHPENEQIVKEVFVALDRDGNGTLDRDEYREFIRMLLGHDTSLLKSEKLGVLSGGILGLGVEKLRDQMLNDFDASLDQIFKKADTNNDGVISYEEFTNYLKAHFVEPTRFTLGVCASDIENMVKEEEFNS